MPYAALDDGFHSHPKVLRVGLDGAGLYARALSYCADKLTDGVVPVAWAREAAGGRRKLLDALSAADLWTPVDGGFLIPDYLDFNPSRSEVEAKRSELSKVRAAAGAKGARARWNHGKPDGKPDGNGIANEWPPSPSPFGNEVLSPQNDVEPANATTERDELTDLMNKLAANEDDRTAARTDSARAIATARFTLTQPDVQRPLAYYRTIWRTGTYPEHAEHIVEPKAPLPLFDVLTAWITNVGHTDHWPGVELEITDRQRRRNETLTLTEHGSLQQLWQTLQPANEATAA